MGKRQKLKSSVAFKLSIRFMILVAGIIVLLSYGFVCFLKLNARISQGLLLQKSNERIYENLQNDASPELLNLPYFVTYTVYDTETKNFLYTNDPLLPVLKTTGGNSKKYYKKNFYMDGDLNLLYNSQEVSLNGTTIIIQTSIDMDRDYSIRMAKQLPQAFIIIIIPIILVSFLLSLIISKRTIRPVKEITEAAQKMSSTTLEKRLPVSNQNDEIDKLAQTFNNLFDNLQKDFDQERNFTSNVSHELKTPIAGILGQANLLKRWGKEDPKQVEQSLDLIISEANSMNYIISNLLQISKLENGNEEIFKESLDLLTLFNRLEKEFSVTPNLKISFDQTQDFTFVTDIELLHQVLTAIISNSIKFFKQNLGLDDINEVSSTTQSLCQIELAGQKTESRIIITVSDNGPGFDEEIIPHIFERFYRGDKAHSRKAGGAGLGLAISSSIVTALGGTIQAKNKADVSISEKNQNIGSSSTPVAASVPVSTAETAAQETGAVIIITLPILQ